MLVRVESLRLEDDFVRCIGHGVALVVPSGAERQWVAMHICATDSPEERVAQNHIVYLVHTGIFHDIPIDEEEYWQVDFFACSNFLLFEAEAFDFGKVGGDLKLA